MEFDEKVIDMSDVRKRLLERSNAKIKKDPLDEIDSVEKAASVYLSSYYDQKDIKLAIMHASFQELKEECRKAGVRFKRDSVEPSKVFANFLLFDLTILEHQPEGFVFFTAESGPFIYIGKVYLSAALPGYGEGYSDEHSIQVESYAFLERGNCETGVCERFVDDKWVKMAEANYPSCTPFIRGKLEEGNATGEFAMHYVSTGRTDDNGLKRLLRKYSGMIKMADSMRSCSHVDFTESGIPVLIPNNNIIFGICFTNENNEWQLCRYIPDVMHEGGTPDTTKDYLKTVTTVSEEYVLAHASDCFDHCTTDADGDEYSFLVYPYAPDRICCIAGANHISVNVLREKLKSEAKNKKETSEVNSFINNLVLSDFSDVLLDMRSYY